MRLPLLIQKPLLISALCFALPLSILQAETGQMEAPAIPASYQFANQLSEVFRDISEQITPSVVNIRSTMRRPQSSIPGMENMPPGMENLPEPFREFFERFGAQPQLPQQPQPGGLGSGVIIDSSGHILTNNHVVANADEVTVRLSDKRTFKATIVGTDPRTDLAVIKIEGENLVPARLGNSDTLSIGEWVVAVGAPFGLENTITAGIVSAKGRSIMGGNAYEDFIQTDAAINPGNSGGPLVNLRGEVVGINTAIVSRTGGYMGIGFAIPSSLAKNVFESLIQSGRVIRGWLGVGIQNLSEELASSFEYSETRGALVGHIAPDGPAAKSELKQGDIVVAFNGIEIEDVSQLRNMVAASRPNTQVALRVVREGKARDIQVRLGELPSDEVESPKKEDPKEEIQLGLQLETLTDELSRQLETSSSRGVVVRGILPGSPAAIAGFQPGDIIKRIDNTDISSVDDFRKLVTPEALKRGVRMIVENRGMERFAFLKKSD